MLGCRAWVPRAILAGQVMPTAQRTFEASSAHARVEPEVCRDREHTGLQAYGGAAAPASTASARRKKGRKSGLDALFPPPRSPRPPPVFPVGKDATSSRAYRSAGAPWPTLLLKEVLSSISCSLCSVSLSRITADRRDPQ
jgi:hypothetical protein